MSWTLLGIIGAAALAFISAVFGIGRKSGGDAQKVKQAQAERAELDRVKRANDAGANIRPDDPRVRDDPFNRDR